MKKKVAFLGSCREEVKLKWVWSQFRTQESNVHTLVLNLLLARRLMNRCSTPYL